jgi:DNA-binding TFAR19-related protein (PDSD5 family)
VKGGGGGGQGNKQQQQQEERMKQMEDMKNSILSQVLDQEARQVQDRDFLFLK